MSNMGALLCMTEDCEGALDYYQQGRRVQEIKLGKTHPDTLMTIMNMASTYKDGLKDFTKAERMYSRLWMATRNHWENNMRGRRSVQGTWQSCTSKKLPQRRS